MTDFKNSEADRSQADRAFEESLEASLRQSEKPARKWNWEWVNRPITLWALSSIAVGIISFFVTQASKCTEALGADRAPYVRLMTELNGRAGALKASALMQGDTVQRRESSREAMAADPSAKYLMQRWDKNVK